MGTYWRAVNDTNLQSSPIKCLGAHPSSASVATILAQ